MSLDGLACLNGKLPLYCHHKVHATLLPASAHRLDAEWKALEANSYKVFSGAVDSENGVHGSEASGEPLGPLKEQ